MPNGTHQMEVSAPIERVWAFVSDMNNWAPLVPGYMEHQFLHERQSTWKFTAEVGAVQKTVELRIDITDWKEPEKVTFDLTGISEKVKGDGYFEAEALAEDKTKITSQLHVAAKGLKGPVFNPILKSFLPKTTQKLTEAIADSIMRQRGASV